MFSKSSKVSENMKFSINKMKKNSYVLHQMVKKNFKAQYRNSILGVFWTVLNPLLNMLVLTLVFSELFGNRSGVGIYPIYLFCGNLFFNILRQVTTQSMNSIVGNAGLIKKVKISYSIFPVSSMFTALVNFSVAFIALIVVMLIVHQTFYWTILMTITILPALLLFSLGLGFILASLYVFFRDIKHIYEVVLTLWMYLTPIFYTVDSLKKAKVIALIKLNPMYNFITIFRGFIQWGTIAPASQFLICYAWGIGTLLVGIGIYKLTKKKFILYI